MKFVLSNGWKMAALAAVASLGWLAAGSSAALADYTTTRCDADGDHCWVMRCEDDGDDCVRIRSYDRDSYYRGYDRPRARWVCDGDGDRCHWVYGGGYYERPHVGFSFGWGD